MSLLNLLLLNLGLILGMMIGLWLLSLPLRNSSIVDIFWGLGFVVVAWSCFFASGAQSPRGLLISVLTSVWGLRLAGYLAWRNLGKGEDYRYVAMREKLGNGFWWISFFVVFLLQGIIMWVVSTPIQVAHLSASPLGLIDAIGAVAWLAGLAFESIGDFQLARFKADPDNKGKVMDRGLWRYTRHPNYFGDFVVWWGLFTISLAGGGWWTIISPIVMSILLMRVSGVTLLEGSLKQKRPGYEEYIARTSSFFPWPPSRKPA